LLADEFVVARQRDCLRLPLDEETSPCVAVLQEEFTDVERDLIVLAIRTTEYDVDEAREYFQSLTLLDALRRDLDHIRNHTSAVRRFRDFLSASPSAAIQDAAALPPAGDARLTAQFEAALTRRKRARKIKPVLTVDLHGLSKKGANDKVWDALAKVDPWV
jgi:hypothetical protein